MPPDSTLLSLFGTSTDLLDALSLTNPDDWLRISEEQILQALHAPEIPSEELDQGFATNMLIYPRFILYVFVHIKSCSKDQQLLDTLKPKQSIWSGYDEIMSLVNHRSIGDFLWDMLGQCKQSDHRCNDRDRVDRLLSLDIVGIVARVLSMLQDPQRKDILLSQRGSEAQSLLNLFQALIDCSRLGSKVLSPAVRVIVKLSEKSSLYPECLVLSGVEKRGQDAVCGGGFGDVWRGQVGNHVVAIKVMRIFEEGKVNRSFKMYSKEAVLWRQLLHPNVLPFYGIYRWNDAHSRICLVSPWMANGNVVNYLERVPHTNRGALVLDIALGLQYLHSANVVHGDLKGANILITPSLRACITDFGLAAVLNDPEFPFTASTSTPTQGTLRWMAPELLDTISPRLTRASDIYSFACVCYEIFVGKQPFYQLRVGPQVMEAIKEGQRPTRPSLALCAFLDDPMWDLIERCWQPIPAERPVAEDIVNRLSLWSTLSSTDTQACDWDEVSVSSLRSALGGNLLRGPSYNGRPRTGHSQIPAPSLLHEISSTTRCRLFVLLVGIDKYLSNEIPDLNGCVNDAKTFHAFLSECLHVPDSQIIFLANETATRSAIISSLSHFSQNIEIQYGDAIVFFYAGHGSRIAAPREWVSNRRIQMLCPHDERTVDTKGEFIHGIPDRTVSRLLRDLSSVKGNNITVIFDTCHSGDVVRQPPHKFPFTVRSVVTTRPIPATLDSSIWKQDSVDVAEDMAVGFYDKFMESHIFLAPCEEEQCSHEFISEEGYPCGFFTNSLVKQLRQVSLDRVTYSELFDLLPELVNQSPLVEGANKHRILFREAAYPTTFMLVKKDDGTFEINAGSIRGFTDGTEFVVRDASAPTKDLGILLATSVTPTSSVLARRRDDKRKLIMPKEARVSVYNWNNNVLKVFLKPGSGDQLAAILSQDNLNDPPSSSNQLARNSTERFIRVDSRSEADIMIWSDSEGKLFIERLDALVKVYAIERVASFDLRNRFERLPDLLDGIANFHCHLKWQHRSDELDGKVTVELYRLTASRALDMKLGNLLGRNHAIVELDKKAKYCVAIINRSSYDLFPYLFYFDPSSYAVDAWYVPRVTSAPLQAQSGSEPTMVTAGYGPGGGPAFQFTLPKNQSSDTGFLKLFVSTEYADLDRIVQPSLLRWRRVVKREILNTWNTQIAAITLINKVSDDASTL